MREFSYQARHNKDIFKNIKLHSSLRLKKILFFIKVCYYGYIVFKLISKFLKFLILVSKIVNFDRIFINKSSFGQSLFKSVNVS